MVSGGAQVVVGASGGLGRAFVEALMARGSGPVYGFSRQGGPLGQDVRAGRLDLTDEASIAAAVQTIAEPVELVIVATGRLHGEGLAPERSFAALDAAALAQSFAVNTIGPALVAKHLLPRVAKERRAVFAALSARVGSVGDNRLGGWYGYRASKAALNMMIRSLAIELHRTRPQAVCVALHPGTVDTALSRPFQRGVRPEKLFDAAYSAGRCLAVLDGLTPAESGGFFAYDGSPIPF
jgi:NAD(P)-dependent dehydrogenase (short-subunit alcohol dehydrogenase family)